MKLISKSRSPESFVAGGVPINLDGPRFSADIDIFHDRPETLKHTAAADIAELERHGMKVDVFRNFPGIISADITIDGQTTKLEWAADSDFRYFPAIPDPLFGYALHPVDLAVNKIMAAAGRRMVRDTVDLVTLHERCLSIGAIAIAAVVVAPGFTPESLLAEVSRNARYPVEDFKDIDSVNPVDPGEILNKLRAALAAAMEFVMKVPSDKIGRVFLLEGKPVEPDLSRLDLYQEHEPMRRGHWPSSSEIGSAMLERYISARD